MQHTLQTKPGFTLIEMLVVMPLIIILVGSLVAAIIYTTGTALQAQAKIQLQLDVLDALDRIEQDVKVSVSTNGITSNSSATQLALTGLSTTKNPLDPTRSLVRMSDCSAALSGLPVSETATHEIIYRPSGSDYVRASYVHDCSGSGNVWQKNVNEVLIKNASVSQVVERSSVISANDTIEVTLTASRKIAGRTISYTGIMYVRSLNMH